MLSSRDLRRIRLFVLFDFWTLVASLTTSLVLRIFFA